MFNLSTLSLSEVTFEKLLNKISNLVSSFEYLRKTLALKYQSKQGQLARLKAIAYLETLVLFIALVAPMFFVSGTSVFASQKQAERLNSAEVILPELNQKPVLEKDMRVDALREYLKKHNSPMVDYADEFVAAADKNDVDWKLVPAITGVESTFGKFIPGGHDPRTISYNGWGWGVYGTQSLSFNSWEHGINTVTEGLKKNYIDKGLKDPYAMNRIYAASPAWGWKVAFFMNDIDKYSQKFIEAQPKAVEISDVVIEEVAGDSANLKEDLIASK